MNYDIMVAADCTYDPWNCLVVFLGDSMTVNKYVWYQSQHILLALLLFGFHNPKIPTTWFGIQNSNKGYFWKKKK